MRSFKECVLSQVFDIVCDRINSALANVAFNNILLCFYYVSAKNQNGNGVA